MNKSFQKSVSSLAGLINTQKNCISVGDPSEGYMHGMANGMILGLSIFTNSRPRYVTIDRRLKCRNKVRHKGAIRKGGKGRK